MKRVDYKDDFGRWFRVMVPDDCPEDMYSMGVPLGPPSLASLGLPLELEIRLHNQLHSRNILTRRDVLAKPREVQGAIQAALKLDMQRIQQLYLEEQG